MRAAAHDRTEPPVRRGRGVGSLWTEGRYRAVIDRQCPLDGIVEANRYVEAARKLGNVVVDVADPAVGGADRITSSRSGYRSATVPA